MKTYWNKPIYTVETPVPTAAFEEITPDYAIELLENMGPNRNLSEAHASKFKRDMVNGNWYATGQGISIDTNGQLADGMHRLWGVIESGVTVKMLVARNIDPRAKPAMDANRVRSFGDDLRIGEEAAYSQKGTVTRNCAKVIVGWKRDLAYATTRTMQFSRFELAAWKADLENRSDMMEAIRAGGRITHRHPVGHGAVASAHVLSQIAYGSAFTDSFYEQLKEVAELKRGDPIFALIDRFRIEDRGKGRRPDAYLYLAWCLKALKASYMGKSLKKIEFPGRLPSHMPQL